MTYLEHLKEMPRHSLSWKATVFLGLREEQQPGGHEENCSKFSHARFCKSNIMELFGIKGNPNGIDSLETYFSTEKY